MIGVFGGEHWYLSNFYPCPNGVMHNGLIFPTTEHAFQAAKCKLVAHRVVFLDGSVGASESKKLGRAAALRGDWEEVKDQIMFEVCMAKFLATRSCWRSSWRRVIRSWWRATLGATTTGGESRVRAATSWGARSCGSGQVSRGS